MATATGKCSTANVVQNKNFINAQCHIALDDEAIAALGGPFKKAKHFQDFACNIEVVEDGPEYPAFSSSAVLTPSGILQINCKAINDPDQPGNGLR